MVEKTIGNFLECAVRLDKQKKGEAFRLPPFTDPSSDGRLRQSHLIYCPFDPKQQVYGHAPEHVVISALHFTVTCPDAEIVDCPDPT
jgi:hypothetical protein